MKNNVTFKPIILVVAVMMATPASGMEWLRSCCPWLPAPTTREQGAQPDAVTPEQIHCLNRLLFEAVKRNDSIQAQTMLRAGAPIDALNQYRNTPLHFAAKEGRAKTVKLLIDAGATIDAREDKLLATPLHYAAEKGDAKTVKVLIDAGATIDAREGKLLATPLHFAARRGHADVAEQLIAAGADPNTRGKCLLTPLHLAVALFSHKDVVKVLIDAGADPEACITPLQLGAVRTQLPNGQPLPPDALRRLMQLGASLHDGHDPRMASWAWALQ